MHEARLEALGREVGRHHPVRSPELALAAWCEVGRLVARTGERPGWLEPRHLPGLLSLWEGAARSRELGCLILPLLGLEPVSNPGPAGAWWEASGRLGRHEGECFDLETGLPLEVSLQGMAFRWVPGGWFLAARNPGRGGEGRHRVRTEGFFIGRFPVTVDAYQRLAVEAGARPPPFWREQLERPRRPVVFVSEQDAARCAGRAGARLATASEWEKAARGTDGRTYPWGEEEPDPERCNFDPGVTFATRSWSRDLTDVDAHLAGSSPFGVEGMVGNVDEWCADRIGVQAPGPPLQSLRGGSWRTERTRLRSWASGWLQSGESRHTVGFRLARDLLPDEP